MDKYEIMLYPRAYRDIHDIYAYIALEKLSPETAKEQTDRIWQAIKKLELFPKRHKAGASCTLRDAPVFYL